MLFHWYAPQSETKIQDEGKNFWSKTCWLSKRWRRIRFGYTDRKQLLLAVGHWSCNPWKRWSYSNAYLARLGFVWSSEGGTTRFPFQCQHSIYPCVTMFYPTHPFPETTIETNLKRFWELESLGISPDEHSVYEQFLSTVKHRDGRYEVHLPWKDNQVTIPDNYHLSLRRLARISPKETPTRS